MTTSTATPMVFENLTVEQLIQQSLARKETQLSANQTVAATTGSRTGRSPKDRFIVKDAITENTVNWGAVNQSVSSAVFAALWEKAQQYLHTKDRFVSHLRVGASATHHVPVKVITELAWHHLFCRNMFISSDTDQQQDRPEWTLLSLPYLNVDPSCDGVNSDGCVILNFSERKVLLCGMFYAGEMKKAMFSVLNFLLTDQDVLPMHCAANKGEDGSVALFFGLSGTGKTTLSSDPERYLIGDDEHGWSREAVFNFEGGCYAKCIRLTRETEPVIWDAIRQGAVMENVVLKDDLMPDFFDATFSENSRVSYPRHHIEKRVEANYAGIPNVVLFLTCDLYGVLPPVAKLTKTQAAYYFLSGYTAKVGGTEMGGNGVAPTFSTCFGEPFFPRPPHVYSDLLMKRIEESKAAVYLVNTGWTGGAFGKGGERFSIATTRAIVRAIINGTLNTADYHTLPGFNLAIPHHVPDVDTKLLDPRLAWKDEGAYDKCSRLLREQFIHNFTRFEVNNTIKNAGPVL